jgi:hypothetical protein
LVILETITASLGLPVSRRGKPSRFHRVSRVVALGDNIDEGLVVALRSLLATSRDWRCLPHERLERRWEAWACWRSFASLFRIRSFEANPARRS